MMEVTKFVKFDCNEKAVEVIKNFDKMQYSDKYNFYGIDFYKFKADSMTLNFIYSSSDFDLCWDINKNYDETEMIKDFTLRLQIKNGNKLSDFRLEVTFTEFEIKNINFTEDLDVILRVYDKEHSGYIDLYYGPNC